VLNDNGKDGDLIANDGIASFRWTPTSDGIYDFTFSPDEVVRIKVEANNT
jgi:hypothetical protein